MKNTILVIEDNLEVRENTAELLELNGYDVQTAANGSIGFEKVKKQIPDIVICDISMPQSGGLEFFKMIRADKTTEAVPLIFFSAGSAPAQLKKIIDHDHTLFLLKPFTGEELIEKVEKSLKNK